ncbi:MAG TPA: potassium-transporting ATPase subunit KdpC [Acidobacteriaceae bacterium]|nr:potassium-transporting ATPase subunit KdpC [Acidobacteriaceae bacterium]
MKHLRTALLYTLVSAVFLGLGYPLAMTALAHWIFPRQANGSLIHRDGKVIGSALIGQEFTGSAYFHSRPSEAGNGYDATASGGSNLAPTNHALIARIESSVAAERVGTAKVPVDLVTASASGLDPDITPAAAYYQAPRVAQARHLPLSTVNELIAKHITPRQFGLLGEERVNVLELNLALDQMH